MNDDITYARQRELPRLIVADDDAVVRSVLATQLEYSFECIGTAANTDEAIAVVAEHRPDVAILDVVMPGGGALAATRAIRACSPETAIVILSGDELHSEVVDLLTAGATSYLRKGIDGGELASGLSAAISAHRHAMNSQEDPASA